MYHPEASNAVLRVGDGCGFVVWGARNRLVITAAHCLPHFPPCASASSLEERTYPGLLAEINEQPSVWTECLFVDPISDIAVLGSPDTQALSEQADAYGRLIEARSPVPIANPKRNAQAWLLSLEGGWFPCTVQHNGGALWLFNAKEGIVAGMSGSPIISDDGAAIGIVCVSGGTAGTGRHTSGGPNPRLAHHLPGWVLRSAVSRGQSGGIAGGDGAVPC
jgi:hypothetical protein